MNAFITSIAAINVISNSHSLTLSQKSTFVRSVCFYNPVTVRSPQLHAGQLPQVETMLCTIKSNALPSSPYSPASKQNIERNLDNICQIISQEMPFMMRKDYTPDWSIYASDVKFEDPITKFTGVEPYKRNIKLLKDSFVFQDTILVCHDVTKVTPCTEYPYGKVMTRWTMQMQFCPFPWKPILIFTGTSHYRLNSQGKVDQHFDYWDALEKNEYFSFEGLVYVIAQLKSTRSKFINQSQQQGKNSLAVNRAIEAANRAAQAAKKPSTRDVLQPTFQIYKKFKDFEIRSYDPINVVQYSYTTRADGLQTLDTYCSGVNSEQQTLPPSAPLMFDFPQGLNGARTINALVPSGAPEPTPDDSGIVITQFRATKYACLSFIGSMGVDVATAKRQELEDKLKLKNIKGAHPTAFRLAQYNALYSLPWNRYNEIWIPIEEQD